MRSSLFDIFSDFDSIYNYNFTTDVTRAVNKANIETKDDKSVLLLDLPGFKKNEINITATRNNITVKVDGARGKKSYIYTINYLYDYKGITSKFEDGVLTIEIPFKKNKDDVVVINVE